MIGARVGDHRLIHVVATEAIGRQDHEVNGARETNVLEDGIQGTTADVAKTPRLVVDLHDGRDRVTLLRYRMDIDVVGSAQPHGRDEEQEETGHEAQDAQRCGWTLCFPVSPVECHRCHGSTLA